MEKSETERIKLILRVESLEARIKVKDEALRENQDYHTCMILEFVLPDKESLKKIFNITRQALAADGKEVL